MPILETVAFAIVPILAKAVINSFVKEGLINDISGTLVDLFADQGEQSLLQRGQLKPLAAMTRDVANNMSVIFRNTPIDKESRTVVVEEFARTLAKASITSEKLIQFNLEPTLLERYLRSNRPEATSRLSQPETDYYDRLLHEASKATMAIAQETDDFERQFAKSMLVSQDEILEKVMLLLQTPQNEAREFEERYCGVVKRELDRLETFGLRQIDSATSRQSLSIAYITLQASAQGEFNRFEQEMDRKDFYRHRAEAGKIMKSSTSIDMILARSRRIVVRGEAGSGKSTLLQWIAVRSSEHDFPDNLLGLNNTVPFFIRLREHVKTGFPSPEEFPAQVARMLTGEMPASWVHDQLDSGRAIVLVDGVDELPQSRRTEMLQSLRQLLRAYPYARYLVTSRPTAIKAEEWPEWQDWVKEEGFVETTLQPMSIPQIEEFIDHWYSALTKSITDEKEKGEIQDYPRDLKQLLRQRLPLRRLATTPILCAMICALYRERQQSLPSERIELYQGCVEMLLTRRDEGRKINREEDYPNLSYSQMLALIQNFAYWLLQNDYSDVELAEADERFEQWLENMNFEATGEAVRRLFVDRSGLLREPVMGRVDFTHRTFQEYLAAQAAVKEGDIGVLIKNARNDLWRETIILAVGEARPKEREKLLTKLLKKGEDLKRKENKYQVFMLAIASLETAVELSPEVRDRVLEKAKEIIPPWDAEEVRLIAAAGDPIVPLLSWDETYSPSRKARCIGALALIGSKKAFQVLADYRQDEEAQGALCRAWNKFDVEQFAAIFFENTTRLELGDLTAIALLDSPAKSLPNLTQLELWGSQLSDIGVLGQLPNLTQLTLWGDQLSDIGVLGQLPNLTQLSFWGDQLSDIGVLGQLPNLTQLSLWGAELSDIRVLGQLPNLTQLTLGGSQLSDIGVLGQLPNLTQLSLGGDQLSDIGVLGQLPNLTQLTLWGAQLSDIGVLGQLPNLTQLTLRGDQLSDIGVLGQLPNLTQLTLSSAQLSDIGVLGQLPNLTQLTLSSAQLSDIGVLGQLPNLTQLTLSSDQLSDIGVLGQLPNLTHLELRSDQLSDIGVLGQLPNLTHLELWSDQLSDIGVLGQLPNLTHLELRSDQLSDIGVLGQLPNLTQMSLSSAQLSDVGVLGELSNLMELAIRSDRLNDIGVLRNLSPSIEIFPF